MNAASGALTSSELEAGLEEMMELIWVKEIIDTGMPIEVRRRALLVHFHASRSLSCRHFVSEYLSDIAQIIKGLALLRDPMAYTAVSRIADILKLASFDPILVNEAARGFGVLAEGKGKGKAQGSHLTAKVSVSKQRALLNSAAASCAKAMECRIAKTCRG